jgi:prepilin-type N-terminal cleavage/methylation domain-containing protein
MKKGFTIIELLLAVTLLAILLVVSGAVFRMAAKAYRTAAATGEIARKLRAITDQLDADFRGLRKDGEMLIVWVPVAMDADDKWLDGTTAGPAAPAQIDHYACMDRIMFFANGDFYSYNEWPKAPVPLQRPAAVLRGNVARICYMLAKDNLDTWQGGTYTPGNNAQRHDPKDRILGRSQHIFTADSSLVDFDPADPLQRRNRWLDPVNINAFAGQPFSGQSDWLGAFTQANNNFYEYDNFTMREWLKVPAEPKQEMLTIISDIIVDFDENDGFVPSGGGGIAVNTTTPLNTHQLLCEGVGQFRVQIWYDDPVRGRRWYPQFDLNNDGVITDQSDTDYVFDAAAGRLHPKNVNGVLYQPPDDFNLWVGRAIKFTFTLYDSRGIFKKGKTFTHIVYLDD